MTRSHTLGEATADTRVVLAAARDLLAAARPLIAERGITRLGITFTNLGEADAIQLALPLDRQQGLDAALDAVRDRYGAGSITRAVLVGRVPDIEMPLLPD